MKKVFLVLFTAMKWLTLFLCVLTLVGCRKAATVDVDALNSADQARLQTQADAPIPYEAPPAGADLILHLTNRECFRVNGGRVVLFNLSAEEFNTIKKFKTPSTNGWLWLTK